MFFFEQDSSKKSPKKLFFLAPNRLRCQFVCVTTPMNKVLCALSILSAMSLTNVMANGGFTFYTNQTDFLNAIAGKDFYQEDFEGIVSNAGRLETNSANFSNGTFGFTATIPPLAPDTSLWNEEFEGNQALSTGNAPESLVLTNFTPNTFAFGGYFFPSLGNDFIVDDRPISITILFDDLTSTNYTGNRGTFQFADWFFGWVTSEPGTAIRSVTLDSPDDNAFMSVSDVTLAIPEPSTYALLGLAAAGLAGYVIRRRRS
jgi:hypothetical protein